MSEFEDNLWLAVVREHADELPPTERAEHHGRASRPQLVAGTTVGLAAMATAAVLLFGVSTSPAAFAVTRNPDGTVTVNLMQPSGISHANAKLAAMGVRARIAVPAKTPPKLVCPGGTAPTITFNPASIPKRQEIVIAPGQGDAGNAAGLKTDNAGSNRSGPTDPAAISGGGNHVVRMPPAGSKIRTASGTDSHVVRMYCP
jgi:hypothetical protein